MTELNNTLNTVIEPTKDILKLLTKKLRSNKKSEKEQQLKNGIRHWIIRYTLCYIGLIVSHFAMGNYNNHLMTSKVDDISITLKEYFMIVGYLHIPLYLFTIYDVITFNIPAYKLAKIIDLRIVFMLITRLLFIMTHICIIALVFTAIIISSKLSSNDNNDKQFFIILIVLFMFEVLNSITSMLTMNWTTRHNVLKEVNLYDTKPSDEELYEEFYKQYG